MLASVTRALTPIAVLAAVLALLLPSRPVGNHSDILLAALVLFTALGISIEELKGLRSHGRTIALLSVVPIPLLGGLSWALGRPFTTSIQHGLLGCGLSSAEVASVGLVALAGADATIAVGVVTGSLIASAVIGPLLLGGDPAALLGRFALVVLLPLCIGVAIRSTNARTWLAAHDDGRDGLASLAVAALVYAALSGATHLLSALPAAAAFLAISTLLAAVWSRLAGATGPQASGTVTTPGAFTIAMRDFAVAATLATQAYGAAAGTVPGVYGVLMLIGGSAAATVLRQRSTTVRRTEPTTATISSNAANSNTQTVMSRSRLMLESLKPNSW